MANLDSIENMLEFLIKENLRLTARVINLSNALSDKLEFSGKDPDIKYQEEKMIIEKLKSVGK